MKCKAYAITNTQREAMNREILKQLAEYDIKNEDEIDAIVLWWLHEEKGWGPKRLKEAYFGISNGVRELIKRYELDDSDSAWFCTKRLKEAGIDISAWRNELEEMENGKR